MTLVWDLPTRLFHWIFALGFGVAAAIALLLGEDSPLFPYHAIIGLTLTLMVALRLLWGFIGTRYARFTSFLFKPSSVALYLKGTFLGSRARHVGHNPASAYAIFAMLVIMIGLGVTGVMLCRGIEGAKEVHEFLAYAMLVVVGGHVLGVLLHTLRHRENITASMIHGRKSVPQADGIRTPRTLAAITFVLVIAGWSVGLLHNYDPATQTTSVPLIGSTLEMGEDDRARTAGQGERDEEDADD